MRGKIIFLWMFVFCFIAGGCTSTQPEADTQKIKINERVQAFLDQENELASLMEQRYLLLSSTQKQEKKPAPKKYVQSPQEAAKQKERELATELSYYYTKDKQKSLEEIRQQALDLQYEVNSQSGEHKALVQRAANDFVTLIERDIRLFNEVLNFIHGVDPKLPKYSFPFIEVAEAEGNNCNCTEISRTRISPQLIQITYRCICRIQITLVRSIMEVQQQELKAQMSHEELQNIKDSLPKVKQKDRTVPTTNDPKMGKVEVDSTTGKRTVSNIMGQRVKVSGGQYAGTGKTRVINGKQVTVNYDKNGFPDFTPHTTYHTTLPRSEWFQSDEYQFTVLNKELYTKMSSTPALKTEIDNTFLSVLQYGNGRGNGAKKVKTFLNETPETATLLTPEDRQRLMNGEGVTPQTWNRMNSDPHLKEQLLQSNVNWIKNGKDPIGYVWNHHQNPGHMQLVNHKVHAAIPHTGGRNIWGGGNYFR